MKLRRFVSQLANLGRESASRNSDVTGADAEAPWCIDDANRVQKILQVRERLAHAHEYDVVDFFSAVLLDPDELLPHLACTEIARPAFQSARAKFAAISAPDLTGDTNCPAI